jgi:hypothetical protein
MIIGILRLLFRGTREFVQEQSAKKNLESKLGRKVSKDELYSLGAHLDAAQPNNAQKMPLQQSPYQQSVPFADAKPPMRLMTKLILAAILLLIVGVIGVFAVVIMTPRHTFTRLNPFGPKPPDGTFPAKLGNYALEHKPDFEEQDLYNPRSNFASEYSNGTEKVQYKLWLYNSEAEMNSDYEARKKYITSTQKAKVVDNSDTRYFVAAMPGWTSAVLYKDGKNLRQITAYKQQSVLDVEGFLKNAPPVPAVTLSEADFPASSNTNGNSISIKQLLDDYKKDSDAAEKKYDGKTITINGTVEVSDRDKQGKWMIAFLRPGSTKPADGMVICSFEKSNESNVTSVKKGDTVMLKGTVIMNLLGNIMLEKCSKP